MLLGALLGHVHDTCLDMSQAAAVRLLLVAGAEAGAATLRGITPLHLAAMHGHLEACRAERLSGTRPRPVVDTSHRRRSPR
jgi:hypothetical protein